MASRNCFARGSLGDLNTVWLPMRAATVELGPPGADIVVQSNRMKPMDASRVRGGFASVLEAVRKTAETVVVVRYGRPVAALVHLDRLTPRELRALEREHHPRADEDDSPG
jgi:antitoxin (DNA-binding transcriptional repressor) of toxin-antitoxin stability system